jgi:NADH-ubiquinone oxidoreductase chain 2
MLILALFVLLTAVALPSITLSLTASLITRTAGLIFLVCSALATSAFIWTGMTSVTAYNGLLTITPLSLLAQMMMGMLAAFTVSGWAPADMALTLTSYPRVRSYALYTVLAVTGGSLLVSAGDLMTVYLSLELQSFSVYVLSSMYRDEESATHSGLLYFLLGGLSSCLLLFGFGLVYSQLGVTSLDGLVMLLHVDTTETAS